MAASFLEFGRFLQSQRELRGLSRDEIVKATRIPATLVAALEDGQAERLPERVFVVNQLRAYAACLGLSPDEVVNRFHEIPGALAPTEQSPASLEAARRKSALVVLSAVVAVLVVGLVALYLWTKWQIAANLGGR